MSLTGRVGSGAPDPLFEVILWATYNRHLLHVIPHVDPAFLERTWKVPDRTGELPNLRYLIEDYHDHVRHHLAQIKALVPDSSFDSCFN